MSDERNLVTLLERQRGIVSRGQVLDAGISQSRLRWQIRTAGPWQVVLPGVYATFTGHLTRVQRWQAALLYAGAGALLTGAPALDLWGIGRSVDERVPVLIAHPRHRTSRDTVTIIRTERAPDYQVRSRLPVAEPVRATADACRLLTDLQAVRAVVTEALRSPLVTLPDLELEAHEGQRRGSARLLRVLGEYGDGVRSVAEAEARDKLLRLDIPAPGFNVDLFTPGGEFLARPDAYWPEAGLAFEVDSRRHHGDMEDWERTQRRHALLTAHGVTVIHASPHRIATDWARLSQELLEAYRIGRRRPAPAVTRQTAPAVASQPRGRLAVAGAAARRPRGSS